MGNKIKKIIKYVVISFAVILFVIAGTVGYLYLKADMKTPTIGNTPVTGNVDIKDNFRHYNGHFLRQNNYGLWELKTGGNAFERGVAIGKLTEDLLYFQEKVFVDQIKEIIPSEKYLKFLRFFIILFNRNLGENIQQEFREEIYGISLSCTNEYNFIGSPYERQLNYHSAHDLGHALQDYMLVGCTSFATWGDKSQDSTLIIGRNFDFYMGDDFARNKLVAFYAPEKGYKFASVGWAGMTGVLSGMNETGLTVTINAARSEMPTSSATPISILTREILQYASTIDEAYQIALQRKTFVAESILIGSAKEGKAAIIEKSPTEIALYTQEDNQLICTNHYQSERFSTNEQNRENILTSDSPHRFKRVEKLLQQHQPVNEGKAAEILRDRFLLDGEDPGLANELAINQFIAHHSVIFKPEQLLMWVSTSPWQLGEYIAYDLNKVFSDTIDFAQEIYEKQLTIEKDPFLSSPLFEQLLTYKELTTLIRKRTDAKERVGTPVIERYRNANPTMFHTHDVLGDYYFAVKEYKNALEAWEKALTCPIPKQGEREFIERKIKKYDTYRK